MTSFAVWGSGPAQADLIRSAEQTSAAHDEATRRGFDPFQGERWAVEVEAEEHDMDVATQHDAAVVGYAVLGSARAEANRRDLEAMLAGSATLPTPRGQQAEALAEQFCAIARALYPQSCR